MKFNDDFKVALSQLPSVEKDRLLWRLIKRDKLLARRLEFELLAPYDAIDKRNELAELIRKEIAYFCERGWRLAEILTQCRGFSGDITRHVYVTKDKIGEVSLNFVLLIEALDILNNPMYKFSWRTAQRYVNYMVNKLFRTCMLINKLHVDLHIELEDEAHKLGKIIGANDNLMKQMIRVMFDVNWLLELDIPEDIDKHYKEIRQQGFLR